MSTYRKKDGTLSVYWDRRSPQERSNRLTPQQRRESQRRTRAAAMAEKLRRGSCADCGLQVTAGNHVAFDWDHIDRGTKIANVSALHKRGSIPMVLREIAKCVLRCSNCHRIKSCRDGDFTPHVVAAPRPYVIDNMDTLF